MRSKTTPGWREKAKCKDGTFDTELYFPLSATHPMTRAVVDYCTDCAVKNDCLEAALEIGDTGIWGGTTDIDRRKILLKRRVR